MSEASVSEALPAGVTVNRSKSLSVASLKPWPENPRKHSAQQVSQIANLISEYGFTNPLIIDENKVILAGHGRLAAAKQLVIKKVPCIRVDGLSENQKRAFVIADNKVGDNSTWDKEILGTQLTALKVADFDLGLTGFTDESLGRYIVGENNEGGGASNGGGAATDQYGVIVACDDEAEQERIYNELHEAGYDCKVVVA